MGAPLSETAYAAPPPAESVAGRARRRPLAVAAVALGLALAVATSYAAGGWLGFKFAGTSWPFWPANGITFAVLVNRPLAEWRYYLPAAVLGELGFSLATGVPLGWLGYAVALLNVTEAAAVAGYCRLRLSAPFDLREVNRVLHFGAAVALCTAGSAALVTLLAWIEGKTELFSFWANFLIGDALGILVVGPALLAMTRSHAQAGRATARRRRESFLLFCMFVALCLVVFGWSGAGGVALQPYLAIPGLCWIAMRFGTTGTSFGALVLSVIAVVMTAHGSGPFAHLSDASLSQSLAAVQVFIAVTVITALLLGAAVSERRQALLALRTLNSELERRVAERTANLRSLAEELESFSYSVSHDLRAPLRAIDGFSRLAQEASPGFSSEGCAHMSRVHQAVQRMDTLIDDLLRLSRVSRDEIHRVPIDLSALVSERVGELAQAHPPQRAQLSIAAGLTASADPHLLRLALDNLLSNAWKYSAHCAVVQIEFGVTEVDGGTAYFVRDQGIGFDMAYAGRLFAPFTRLHGAEYEGTGVGLAIVRRVIERHGGKVWADAFPGRGATFYFTVPEQQAGAPHRIRTPVAAA